MMACCGFNQTVIGPDRMTREAAYWRQLLNEALNDTRKLRRSYPQTGALQTAYRALDIYYLSSDQDAAAWDGVCQDAYRAFTAFNEWRGK